MVTSMAITFSPSPMPSSATTSLANIMRHTQFFCHNCKCMTIIITISSITIPAIIAVPIVPIITIIAVVIVSNYCMYRTTPLTQNYHPPHASTVAKHLASTATYRRSWIPAPRFLNLLYPAVPRVCESSKRIGQPNTSKHTQL